MKYLSTVGRSAPATLSAAIGVGLADDGGLFVPEVFPTFQSSDFARVESLVEVATILLSPFFSGDEMESELAAICHDAFSFPVPLRPLPYKPSLAVLELFHGPTAAFKDVGARFLAACLQRLEQQAAKPLKVLVATSGDTGGAVAAAFHQRPGIEVYVLYPAGLVSPRQEKQLTCWDDNVHVFRVGGVFDDCQRLVKEAFASSELRSVQRLTSANSISIGRLLPQSVYYAAAALWHWREYGRKASFVVPTGNLGNAVAGIWARHMGLPIDRIVLATNANRTIPDYLETGRWEPRQSLATLASAMDVGNPSNMERLRHLHPDVKTLNEQVSAWAVSDEQIRNQIKLDYEQHDQLWCPHTATAAYVHDHYLANGGSTQDHILVATAHPAKFETVIEPLIEKEISMPPALAKLMHLPSCFTDLSPDYAAFQQVLRQA
ncbi:MAG: threonine synthase [Gammaproteobacteria bacterium]|nr:threonine synthase [Gammaproteobacteria bacterium]